MVRVGSTPITIVVKKWTITVKTDKIDTSNTEGGGYTENIPGMYSLDFVIEMDDNRAVNHLNNGSQGELQVGLHSAGATGNLKFYLNSTGSTPYWSVPDFLIESAVMNGDVRTAMGLTITGCNHGPWAYPVGTAGATT